MIPAPTSTWSFVDHFPHPGHSLRQPERTRAVRTGRHAALEQHAAFHHRRGCRSMEARVLAQENTVERKADRQTVDRVNHGALFGHRDAKLHGGRRQEGGRSRRATGSSSPRGWRPRGDLPCHEPPYAWPAKRRLYASGETRRPALPVARSDCPDRPSRWTPAMRFGQANAAWRLRLRRERSRPPPSPASRQAGPVPVQGRTGSAGPSRTPPSSQRSARTAVPSPP